MCLEIIWCLRLPRSISDESWSSSEQALGRSTSSSDLAQPRTSLDILVKHLWALRVQSYHPIKWNKSWDFGNSCLALCWYPSARGLETPLPDPDLRDQWTSSTVAGLVYACLSAQLLASTLENFVDLHVSHPPSLAKLKVFNGGCGLSLQASDASSLEKSPQLRSLTAFLPKWLFPAWWGICLTFILAWHYKECLCE